MKNLFLKTAFTFFFFSLFESCNEKVFKEDIGYIIGVENIEIRNSVSLTDVSGFGKGISLEIYELDNSSILKFQNKSPKSLPDKKGKNKWKKSNWRETPIDSFTQKIAICLNYLGGNEKLEFEFNKIKKILNYSKNYTACYYKLFIEIPNKLEFYILDTANSKLYCIDYSF